jgi:hypothetical protein
MEYINHSKDVIKMVMSFLNGYSTLILVIITGIYAYFTYKMAKTMTNQIIADIKIFNKVCISGFLGKQTKQIDKDSYFIFNLLFDVRNRSAGSGSIDKPTLVLKFISDNFEYKIFPKTKESYDTDIRKEGPITNYRTVTNDLGGTIFLRGGESQKIELKYELFNITDDLLKHIKENLSSLEYYIKFTDNLGKNYLLKINTIKSANE